MNRRKSLGKKQQKRRSSLTTTKDQTEGGFFELVKSFIAIGAGSILGMLIVYAVLGLLSLLFISVGSLIIRRNAKVDEETKKSKWNLACYFGAFLVFLGALPWIGFFFQGIAYGAGFALVDSIMGD
jgi:hypothetical protein